MGWRLLDAKLKELTKQHAEQHAAMQPCPNDRGLRELRMEIYKKIAEAGEFRSCTWAIAFCKENGQWYRVNGKHTATLFSQMEKEPDMMILHEKYECDTMEDVARLYATFDSKLASRNTSDINKSFAGTVPALAAVGSRTVSLAVSGISYYRWREQYGQVPAADRAEAILEHTNFILWLDELIRVNQEDEDGCTWLKRAPVAAAMFGTWQKSQRDASDFWYLVKTQKGTKTNWGDRRLAKYLMTVNVNSGNGSHGPRKAQPREFYAKSIHAWNAWRRDEPTDLKYYPNKKPPTPI